MPENKQLAKIPYDYCGKEASKLSSFSAHAHSPKRLIDTLITVLPLVSEGRAFDFYLSDGRYRVACASMSFLHALERGGDMSKVMVGLHDYEEKNRGYARIEQIADLVTMSQKLAVFRLNATWRFPK